MKRVDMRGKTFGRLLVLEEIGKQVVCGCACGSEKTYARGNVLAGYTASCGCLRDERISEANTTHGLSNTPTYISWKNMKQRCTYPPHENYRHYGGRGISYDPRWELFENFLEDMGVRPDGKELDRIDNDGDYRPGNCQWITHAENVAKSRR